MPGNKTNDFISMQTLVLHLDEGKIEILSENIEIKENDGSVHARIGNNFLNIGDYRWHITEGKFYKRPDNGLYKKRRGHEEKKLKKEFNPSIEEQVLTIEQQIAEQRFLTINT